MGVKVRNALLLAIMLFTATSYADMCSNFEKGVKISAHVTAEAFQCENYEAIYQDQLSFYHYSEFCNKGMVCDTIAGAISKYLMSSIPDRYECNPDRAKAVTKAVLSRICGTYIKY